MNKKLIRLTESDLHRIVKESVNKILNEIDWIDDYKLRGVDSTPYTGEFMRDTRNAAHGYVNNSANMPNPNYDDAGEGDYYAAPNRDSEQMYMDNIKFNKAERKRNADADRRWMKSADSRPLYGKKSPNNDIPR